MTAIRTRALALLASLLLLTTLGTAISTPAHADSRLPSTFEWTSSDILISPQSSDTRDVVSIKDPSVVHHDGEWHVFATTASTEGEWNLVYLSFSDWSEAGEAEHHHLDTTAIGPGYRAAPQVFYFEPEQTWYLIYQTGLPSYSTTTDISDPDSWSEPRDFQDEMPEIVADNIGDGHWLDYWIICDDALCHLFSSDNSGQLYRAETSVADFPEGFGNDEIAMQADERFDLFEGSNVYKLEDSDTYLLIVEAIGAEGDRYFRSWTSQDIAGPWTPLADTEEEPFAGAANVDFPGGVWTESISHGEMLRTGIDQNLEIDPCDMRFLYQGMDPAAAGGEYPLLPWDLGLITQTNSPCGSGDPGDPGDPGEPGAQCEADYQVLNKWPGGFQGEVTVHNTGGSPITDWQVSWNPAGDLSIDSLWNGVLEQDGSTVTVSNTSWNGGLDADASAAFGFTASGDPAVPETACTATTG